jgi:hypothetical protein
LDRNSTLPVVPFRLRTRQTSSFSSIPWSIAGRNGPSKPSTLLNFRSRWDSWYVGASHRFNKWFEVGSYYSQYFGDVHHRSGTPDSNQKDLALSFRFDPKNWWIIKAEGHYIEGTGLLRDNAANPVRDDNGWFMLALKTTFTF